jgi:hypothetical protein
MPPATTEETARYVGVADWWGRHVWVERAGVRSALPACGDELIAGFAWGCRGIASRELARAILADATGSPAVAERYCRDLTHAVVAPAAHRLRARRGRRAGVAGGGRRPRARAGPRARRRRLSGYAPAGSSSRRCTEVTLSSSVCSRSRRSSSLSTE